VAKVTVRSVPGTKYTQEIVAEDHTLLADEPASAGGGDQGPGPYEYLLAALGACTSMTVRMYADRKEWDLQTVEVALEHSRVHAEDCDDCDSKDKKIDEIRIAVAFSGDLDDEQRKRLIEIAGRCPVHKTLVSEVKIRLSAAD
jgi:putative redox protein